MAGAHKVFAVSLSTQNLFTIVCEGLCMYNVTSNQRRYAKRITRGYDYIVQDAYADVDAIPKSQKIRPTFLETYPHPLKKKSFPYWGLSRKIAITPKQYY
jgi:hypothetical protein